MCHIGFVGTRRGGWRGRAHAGALLPLYLSELNVFDSGVQRGSCLKMAALREAPQRSKSCTAHWGHEPHRKCLSGLDASK